MDFCYLFDYLIDGSFFLNIVEFLVDQQDFEKMHAVVFVAAAEVLQKSLILKIDSCSNSKLLSII